MNPKDAARKLQRALELQRAGRLPDAATICNKLIRAWPTAPDPLHLLGLIRRQQGRFDDAQRLLLASIRHSPPRADYLANLGNLYTATGQLAQAEDAYRKALAIDPAFRPARLALARLCNRQQRFEDGETEARALLQLHRDDAQAWIALSVALRGLDRLEDAERACREALAAQPGYGLAHHDLGAVLAERYRYQEALGEYDAAAAAGIDDPVLHANRARALVGVQRIDEARELLDQTVLRYPRAGDAQMLLAKLRHMNGEADFDRDVKKATRTHPEDVELSRIHAQLLRGAGQAEAAAHMLQQTLERLGPNAVLLAELASAQQEAGEFEASLQAAREAARLAPDDPHREDRFVDALLSLGRADEAMPLIRAARRTAPNDQWHIACEATAARLLGDPLYEELYDYDRFVRAYTLPTPPGWSDLDTFNRDLAAVLSARNHFRIAPLDQSLRHGTQTPVSLLADSDPVIRAYLQALLEPIEAYRRHIGNAAGHPLTARNHGRSKIQGAWSVHLRRGGYHVNHVHPEGWISSAYYVQVPAETRDPAARHGWIQFGEPRFPVPGATAEKIVQPSAGLLVLFPSYMWHGTTPILGDESRMTAPFDVVPEQQA
jgi:tetratricopeptide (TPR) repeat protein